MVKCEFTLNLVSHKTLLQGWWTKTLCIAFAVLRRADRERPLRRRVNERHFDVGNLLRVEARTTALAVNFLLLLNLFFYIFAVPG